MVNFFAQYREFYMNGVPTDNEWNAMIADVQKAFNILSAHWGDNTISARYDLLTLIRVAKEYLPKPQMPRPTGEHWYYLIKNNQ